MTSTTRKALRARRARDARWERLARLLDEVDADIAATETRWARLPRSAARTRAQLERSLAALMAEYAATLHKLALLVTPADAPEGQDQP
jgi:hypothetical protein